MEESILNNNKFEVEFTSTDNDIIQTSAKGLINVFIKVNSASEWVLAGNIDENEQVTAISITKGLKVKLSSNKPFKYIKK